MIKALKIYDDSITDAKELTLLFNYLSETVKSPYVFDDILRSQVVYSVSEFDKLMHDLIRIGVVASYVGIRPATDRYQTEPITMKLHTDLVADSIPPKEILFEQEVVKKLGYLSFQEPVKVADGLSLIWDEKHKGRRIAEAMGWDSHNARTKLKLIADRRNAIVHESDMDPLSSTKTEITMKECTDVTDFIQLCGQTIAALVIQN